MWVIIINQKQKAKAKKASVSISFTKKQKKPSSSHCQPTIGYACSFVSVHTAAVIIYGLSKLSPHFAVLSSHPICFVPVSKPHNRASSYETRKLEIFRNGKVPRLQPCADLARLNRPSRSVTARTCVEADRSSLTPFLVAGQ